MVNILSCMNVKLYNKRVVLSVCHVTVTSNETSLKVDGRGMSCEVVRLRGSVIYCTW